MGNTFQWSDNFSKMIGNHSMKFGGDIRYQKFDQTLYFDVNGSYTCISEAGQRPGWRITVPNYLLGLWITTARFCAGKSSKQIGVSVRTGQLENQIKPYLELRVALGSEFAADRPGAKSADIYSGAELDNLSVPAFARFRRELRRVSECHLTACNTGVLPTGLVVPGDKGIPLGLTNTYYKSFAPRIGMAWSPGATDGFLAKIFGGPGKSSVRAGFGIFYNPVEQLVLEQFSAEPPFGGSTFVFNTNSTRRS